MYKNLSNSHIDKLSFILTHTVTLTNTHSLTHLSALSLSHTEIHRQTFIILSTLAPTRV